MDVAVPGQRRRDWSESELNDMASALLERHEMRDGFCRACGVTDGCREYRWAEAWIRSQRQRTPRRRRWRWDLIRWPSDSGQVPFIVAAFCIWVSAR